MLTPKRSFADNPVVVLQGGSDTSGGGIAETYIDRLAKPFCIQSVPEKYSRRILQEESSRQKPGLKATGSPPCPASNASLMCLKDQRS